MTTERSERLSTGVSGLDEVLAGGLIPRRTYMIRGPPGAGKTLLGLQFLVAGTSAGEDALFVALEEAEDDIRENAASVGLDASGVDFLDLSPGSEFFREDQSYDIFSPSEVEGESLASSIAERIERADPDRVVFDPATRFRYLAPDEYQFRKQILSFVRFLREQDATVVFTTQAAESNPDDDLQFLSDGVIDVAASAAGRSVSVPKFRGSDSQRGDHAFRISDDGLAVYPELVPERHTRSFAAEAVPSGVPGIDSLLGGGIERGTVTIVSGPTGVGKTTLGAQFMKESAGRGERSVMYLFEENRETFLERSTSINLPVRAMIERGTLAVEVVEALQRSPAEFAHDVRAQVEREDSEIVMIDGVDGYRMSLQGQATNLTRELHSLCRYLKNMGVTVILVDEAGSVTGEFVATSENISYLADNIVFLRYLELDGELRKAIGVLKKRTSTFERTLREFEITEHGLTVGEPLSELRGILRGTPERASSRHHTDDR
ncbi:MAG: ATPase domain-containing protein [Haloarculaceae archaeon]